MARRTERVTLADKIKKVIVRGRFDFILFIIIMCLLLFGISMLLSASSPMSARKGNIYFMILKQGLYAAIGFAGMIFLSLIDYHVYSKGRNALIGAAYILMYCVVLFGFASHGAQRQLSLKFFSFQPSEYAKFALVFYYASVLSKKKASDIIRPLNLKKFLTITVNDSFSAALKSIKGAVVFLCPVGILLIACLLQSHLSAAIIMGVVTFLIMCVGGLSGAQGTVFSILGAVGAVVMTVSEEYRKSRVIALFNPYKYSRGVGYQIIQSLYAVGSGGLFGLGLGQSRQKYLYLPEANNDYIFAIVCEELGFVGALIVIALFVLLVWRGISIALNAKDKLGMLMAFGISAIIGLQMLINMSVVLSLAPSTGMQLPFFSSGGSSLVLMLWGMGILLNISKTSRIKKM